MNLRSVRDLDVKDKTVLVRVDYNVPIEHGKVDDVLRIAGSFETINYLLSQNAKIVLMSHLGRPEGKPDHKYSLKLVAAKAAELLKRSVTFVPEAVGPKAEVAVGKMKPGDIVLLENLRFYPGEEANDPDFAKALAKLGQAYVDDAFANVHRDHASMTGITKFLPSAAGFLVEREVKTITAAIENPTRPLLAIIGGAKVTSKIEVLDNLLPKVEHMLIGGAMANTFLAAQGHNIAKSLTEPEEYDIARRVMADAKRLEVNLILPNEVVVADKVKEGAAARTIRLAQIEPEDIIVDLGPQAVDAALTEVDGGGTVIWNGPIGITEIEEFSAGSLRLAKGIIVSGVHSVIGGGDTADFVDKIGLHDKFSFVSTGGGASLELMAGKSLPALVPLEEKS